MADEVIKALLASEDALVGALRRYPELRRRILMKKGNQPTAFLVQILNDKALFTSLLNAVLTPDISHALVDTALGFLKGHDGATGTPFFATPAGRLAAWLATDESQEAFRKDATLAWSLAKNPAFIAALIVDAVATGALLDEACKPERFGQDDDLKGSIRKARARLKKGFNGEGGLTSSRLDEKAALLFEFVKDLRWDAATTLLNDPDASSFLALTIGAAGDTPLHYSAIHGHEPLARRLLDKGASVNAIDNLQSTPLHYSAAYGHEALSGFLLERGAEVNARDKDQSTALHYAAENGREGLARLLLEKEAIVDALDKDQRTPLHFAAKNGQDRVARLLLEKGAALDTKDKDHRTPLHFAAMCGHEALTQILLEKGAEVNALDKEQRTALHFASIHGRERIAHLLLERGASVEARDIEQRTSLQFAEWSGHKEVARIIREAITHGKWRQRCGDRGQRPLDGHDIS